MNARAFRLIFFGILAFLMLSSCRQEAVQILPAVREFSLSDGSSTYPAYDISDGNIYVMLPQDTDLKALKPSCEFDGLSADYSKTDFSDFADPPTVTVKGTERQRIYTVVIFNLPLMEISTPGGTDITTKDWMDGCTLTLRETDGSLRELGAASVRGRGNTTWTFPKKPYAIKFENKTSFFGLPKGKRWNLLANWLDHTLLRTDVGLEIGRRTQSLRWTPGGGFVELRLNGKYLGNYYLVEQIKEGKNRVDISDDGFIIDYDVYYDETYKFKSSVCDFPVNLKFPDENVSDERFKSIKEFVRRLESALVDGTEPYSAYLDVDSFIDWLFVFELVNGGGAIAPKDVYMHWDKGGKLVAGPIWDFDWATFRTDRKGLYHSNSMYYPYLLKDPAFVSRLKQKWSEEKPVFDAIASHIDARIDEISASAERNIKMWPIDRTINGDESLTFDAAAARLRKAYVDRIKALDELFADL